MDIQQLRYAVALARELHFNRAAQSANVTQPTLSQQIKKLEDELGKPLFERSSKQVRLTPAGKKFLPYAVLVLEQLAKGTQEVQEESGIAAGTIRLGVIPTICPYLMPDVIEALGRKAPRVHLEIYEETTPVLLDHLKSGNLDMGILALPVHEKSLISRSLGRETLFLSAGKHHPLAKKKWVTRKDLLGEKLLILQEGHCFGQQTLDFCHLSRRDPQVSFQGSSLTSVMALAESGRGITLVPFMAKKRAAHFNLSFIPFAVKDAPSREIGIVWRVSSPLSKAARVLMTISEEICKKITTPPLSRTAD